MFGNTGVKKLKKKSTGWVLVSPYLFFALLFWCIPGVWSFILTFEKWNMMSPPKFVGFDNFINIFSDKLFLITLRNTFQFIVVYIPVGVALSLFVAWLIYKSKLMPTFFLIVFLLPYVTSGVAYSVIFNRLFAYDGVINIFLRKFGLEIPFFTDPHIAMTSIALLVVWKIMGYYSLIVYAGLQAIPNSIFEAARIDGANERKTFFRITLPLLNPAFTTILVFAAILSVNIFTEPYLITEGGPFNSTRTFVFWTYKTAFELLKAGQGSALALITALISFILVMIIRKFIEKEIVF
ncbi:MAG: sugar ABC transporter permease [Spirochaetales bacterium]|nr:sugar ABC transporter permease [Spirochaetales bacterium]